MIGHEASKVTLGWKKILLWDFFVPLLLVYLTGRWLDARFAKLLIQYIIDLPYIGYPLWKSPLFLWYATWHKMIFMSVPLLLSFGISYRTARIPGPGRAFLRFWQGLLLLRIRKETHVDPFPPVFDRKSSEGHSLIQSTLKAEPLSRVLGNFKRFASDLESDRRKGRQTEEATAYFPIVLSEELRYRHIQVVGGSGSGKSASIIAPILKEDAQTVKVATVTINPKADLYLLKTMVDGARKRRMVIPRDSMPTALISFCRKDSLAYDPLLYGDADALTKKIIGSSEINHPFYKSFQETWLMSFFRVMKTEKLLVDRLMLRHLFHFLTKPDSVLQELFPHCQSEHNRRRLQVLATAKPESLAGVASHISQLVEDESLTHIFDNPKGRMLNLKEVIRKGGNIFIEVDTSSKGPQGRALGRMIMMEIQLLAGSRQSGFENKSVGVQVILDEFASFAYSGFIDLIDKCRSARIGLLLAHQSLGNLQRDNLSKSFKDEIVDNCYTKFFLSLQDETAEWASRQLGTRLIVKKSLTIGSAAERTDTKARETRTMTFKEELEPYVQPSDFNLEVGYGYVNIENSGRLIKGPMRVGYVEEKDLCSDNDLYAFLGEAAKDHPLRPRGGSLIDNNIPPGEVDHEVPDAPVLIESELNLEDSNFRKEALPKDFRKLHSDMHDKIDNAEM